MRWCALSYLSQYLRYWLRLKPKQGESVNILALKTSILLLRLIGYIIPILVFLEILPFIVRLGHHRHATITTQRIW